MDLNKFLGTANDPGAFLKKELEEAVSPVTDRVDRLEKKLDLLILAIGRVEALLKSIQPMVALLKKLPFLK
jgi:Tfp pilus assembly protein PilN